MLEEGRSLLAQAGNVTSRVRRAAERNASVTLTGPGCDAALLDRMVRSYNEADPAHPARTAVGTIDDQLGRSCVRGRPTSRSSAPPWAGTD